MSLNLLDIFKDVAGDQLLKHAGSLLGDSSDTLSSGLGAILPSLLGTIIQKGSSDSGARGLMDFIDGNVDAGLLDDVAGLFSNNSDGLIKSGGGILKFLLGDKLSMLIDTVADLSGMKISSSNSLLKMAAPLLMGVIGKQVKSQGLDLGGIVQMLLGQRSVVAAAAAPEISDLLGFADFSGPAESAEKVAEAVAEVGKKTTEPVDEIDATLDDAEKTGLSRILPWLVLGLAALALLFFLNRGCTGGQVSDGPHDVINNAEQAARDAGTSAAESATAITDAAGEALRSIALPGGAAITAKAGSFLAQIADFLQGGESDPNKAFIFDGIEFESGSATLTETSNTQIDNLAAILKAYADGRLRIEGHTDNTGDAEKNMQLSTERADAVKRALGVRGVAGNRIEAVGKGQTSPIAGNDTEDGRAENRRVEIYFAKR